MKVPVWSYSFLSVYDRCARQGQAKYITKELPYVESKEAAYGNLVHKAFEDAAKRDAYSDDKTINDWVNKYYRPMAHLPQSAEMKLGVNRSWQPVDFFAKDVWGRGKADLMVEVGAESAILFDYKTGKVWEDPLELAVQAVLLKAKYPTLEQIKGCYIWLKEDRYGEVYDLHSMIDKTKDFIENTMEKVAQGLFYAQPNALCGWCDLKTCKHWKDKRKT